MALKDILTHTATSPPLALRRALGVAALISGWLVVVVGLFSLVGLRTFEEGVLLFLVAGVPPAIMLFLTQEPVPSVAEVLRRADGSRTKGVTHVSGIGACPAGAERPAPHRFPEYRGEMLLSLQLPEETLIVGER